VPPLPLAQTTRALTGLTAIRPLEVPLTCGVTVGELLSDSDRAELEVCRTCVGSAEQLRVAAATNETAAMAGDRERVMGNPPEA
jgi:hypothetical protein